MMLHLRLLMSVVLLQTVLGHGGKSLNEVSFSTASPVSTLRQQLTNEAHTHFAQHFERELSAFKHGPYSKSVGIQGVSGPSSINLEGDLSEVDMQTFVDLQLVRNTDRPLALLATRRSGVLLVQMSLSTGHGGVTLTPLAELEPASPPFTGISAGFLSQGIVFYSVTERTRTEQRVKVNGINLDTLTPMNVQYWVRVDAQVVRPLIHFFEQSGQVYFVLQSTLHIYKENYFDRLNYEMLDSRAATAITGFNDDTGYYIVVGMKDHVESPVYVFDSMTSTLHLTQRLVTHNVTDVQHFHDHFADRHYLLLLQDKYPAKIYWFANEQLLEWQNLTPGFYGPATSSFATLGMENIIAVGNQSSVLLYVDNLNGHYKVNYTHLTECSSVTLAERFGQISIFNTDHQNRNMDSHIEGVILLKDSVQKEKYILAYQCVRGNKKTLKIDVLEAKEIELADSLGSTDDLLQSMDALTRMMDGQESVINSLHDILLTDSMMLGDSVQTWTGPIFIAGAFDVEGSLSVQHLELVAPNRAVSRTVEALEGQIETLQSNIQVMESNADDILYKSGNHKVTTSLSLDKLEVGDISFEEEPAFGKWNSLLINDLKTQFLRISSNQTIHSQLKVDNLTSYELELHSLYEQNSIGLGSINGIQSGNLLLSSLSDQIVTGNHVVSHIIAKGNIDDIHSTSDAISINGISTGDTVLQGTPNVNFKGVKSFTNELRVDALKVNSVNSHHFDNWVNSLIRTNVPTTQILPGRVVIKGDVFVDSDVDIRSVDNINLKNLDYSSLKTTGQKQIIKSPVTFSHDIQITGEMEFASVNSILWSDIIDSTSGQKILAEFSVGDALVLRDLDSDNINGIDISSDAVLSDSTQLIYGRISFLKDVTVSSPDGVTMDSGSSINGVDPSELRSLLANVGQVRVVDPFNFDGHLSLKCNVTAETLNGIVVNDLTTHYWRKGIEQIIPVDVSIPETIFYEPVTAQTFNGRKVDEYLLLDEDQAIIGNYKFNGGLIIEKDLLLSPGVTVEGVDFQVLKNDILTLDTDQTVTTEQNFSKGFTAERLFTKNGLINNVSTDEAVLLDSINAFTGNFNFRGLVTVEELVTSGDIVTDMVNELFFETEAFDMVKVDESAIIEGNLIFIDVVEVDELHASGEIDGVSIEELDRRSLKRSSDSPQNVKGPITIQANASFDESLTADYCNGELLSKLLDNVIDGDFEGAVGGRKVFSSIHVVGNADITLYNEFNLDSVLSSIMTRNTNQTVTGGITFDNVIFYNLTTSLINGISLDEILLTSQPSSGTRVLQFRGGVTVFDLEAPNDVIAGCDLRGLETRMNWRDYHSRTIDEPLSIKNLHVTGDVNTFSEDVLKLRLLEGNTEGLQEYTSSFVTKLSDQVITGEVIFSSGVTVKNLDTSSINEIDIDRVIYNSLRKSNPVIGCNINFMNPVTANNLKITGNLYHRLGVNIDSINIKKLSEEAARKSILNKQTISGTKSFPSGLIVMNNLEVSRMNGMPLTGFITLELNGTIDGEIIFDGKLLVKGDLHVGGLLDGVSLDAIVHDRIPLDNLSIPDANLSFDELVITGDLITSKINDVSLHDLVIHGLSEPQVMTGNFHFSKGLAVDGDIDVLSDINGVDITNLNKRVAILERDEIIYDDVVFKNEVFAPDGVVLGGDVALLDFDKMHDAMEDLNITMEEDLTTLRTMSDSLEAVNALNLNRVLSLRAEYDSLSELAVYEASLEATTLSSLYLPGMGLKVLLGLQGACNQSLVGCYCSRTVQLMQAADSGGLVSESLLPGVFSVLASPSLPRYRLYLHTTCAGGDPSTEVGLLDLVSGSRSPVTRLPLSHVTKSKILVFNSEIFVVVIATPSGVTAAATQEARSEIHILKLEPASEPVNRALALVQTVSVKQSLVDLCVMETIGTWSVVAVSRLRHPGDASVESYHYEWNTHEQKLVLRAKYPGYGVSSCLLLSAPLTGDNYLLLAQEGETAWKKTSKSKRYSRNGSPPKRSPSGVLIFRQSSALSSLASPPFEPHQRLPLSGVTAMINMTVGNQLLAAVVTDGGLLYIHELIFGEGFRVVDRVNLPQPRPRGLTWVGPDILYQFTAGGKPSVPNILKIRDEIEEHGDSLFDAQNLSIFARSFVSGKNSGVDDHNQAVDETGNEKVSSALDGFIRISDEKISSGFQNGSRAGTESLVRDNHGTESETIKLPRAGYKIDSGLTFETFHDETRMRSIYQSMPRVGSALSKTYRFPLGKFRKTSAVNDLLHDTVLEDSFKDALLDRVNFSDNSPEVTILNANMNSPVKSVERLEVPLTELNGTLSIEDLWQNWTRSSGRVQSNMNLGNERTSHSSSLVIKPSYLAVSSESGITLYEIKTLGIDGERLVKEIQVVNGKN